jgi:hypothetical protein
MKEIQKYTREQIMLRYNRSLQRSDNKARYNSLMGGKHYLFVGQIKCFMKIFDKIIEVKE